MVVQTSWVPAKVRAPGLAVSLARSIRWIIARPMPLSAETMGSRIGSAYGAKIRITTWQAIIRPASQPP